MLFTSVKFYVFFALLLAVFYACPRKARWCVLLAGSLIFCWSFNTYLTIHIMTAVLLSWAVSREIARNFEAEKTAVSAIDKALREERKAVKAKYKKQRKAMAVAASLLLVLSLLFFKFYNPFATLMESRGVLLMRIMVPVGISFYTLQLISYIVDVYNQNQEAEKNPLRLMLFGAWFPLLLEGPIHRYSQLAPELRCEKPFNYDDFVAGFARVLGGFLKKLIIADRISVLTITLYENYTQYSGAAVAFAGIAYAVQLYADFSGGIDMAIGFSKMLGIDIAENFRRPFFSRSVSEFWRRWHITLGAFLKDYVFYPLTLSKPMGKLSKNLRKSHPVAAKMLPAIISMAGLWVCSAVWHGEGAQYLLWGGLQWLLVALDTLFLDRLDAFADKKIPSLRGLIHSIQIFGTFIFVCFSEIIFRAESFSAAIHMVGSLFGDWNLGLFFGETLLTLGLDKPDLWALAVSSLLLFIFELLQERGRLQNLPHTVAKMPLPARWAVLLGSIAVLLIFGVYGKGYDPTPFVYFKF